MVLFRHTTLLLLLATSSNHILLHHPHCHHYILKRYTIVRHFGILLIEQIISLRWWPISWIHVWNHFPAKLTYTLFRKCKSSEFPSLRVIWGLHGACKHVICEVSPKKKNVLLDIFSAAQKNIESYIRFCGCLSDIDSIICSVGLTSSSLTKSTGASFSPMNDSSIWIPFILYDFPIKCRIHCLTFDFVA